MCLDGSTVVVTGASAGIGREFAVQLAPRAGTVVLVARRAARLEQLRAELIAKNPQLRVVIVAADLADPDDVERALAEIDHQAGHVDVLVNNAGVGDQALYDLAEWNRTRQVLATNVVAMARLYRRLSPGDGRTRPWRGAQYGIRCRFDGARLARPHIRPASISSTASARGYGPTWTGPGSW